MHLPRRPAGAAALLTAATLTAALLGACTPAGHHAAARPSGHRPASPSGTPATVSADPAFAALERRYGARLGVYVLDTGSGRTVTYRADERFAYASTAKALYAGMLLRRDSDADLAKVITYRSGDLVEHSPVTSQHVATGMTLRDLIVAALDQSDNTAANLMLAQLGGPAALQQDLRGLGDHVTHADRTEPSVNTAIPGDVRDTSTPRAMATDLHDLVLGSVLTPARRQRLTAWLVANTTGGPYIRAGLPSGWQIADRTGNADYGTRNDIAVAWPPGGGAPLVIALLSSRPIADADSDDALLADATRTAYSALH